MLRVAILGASGFIGSRLVESMHLRQSALVRPVVHSLSGLSALSRFDLDIRVADALDVEALKRSFAGCDAVINLVSGMPATIATSIRTVYRAAERAGVRRIVHMSSASVHGQAPEAGVTEETPLSIVQPFPYNSAKVRAERRLSLMRKNGSVEAVVLRPAIVWGPRSRWVVEIASAMLDGSAALLDGGTGICNCVYVDNLIAAIELALLAPAADGQAFFVSDGETVTWRDFYEPIAGALGLSVDKIPSLAPAEHKIDLKHTIEQLRGSAPVQRLLPFIPPALKRMARAGLYSSTSASEAQDKTAQSVQPGLSVEYALLQRCRVRLPGKKAAQILGYAPPVSFAEGSRRTIAWMAFAGYTPHDRYAGPVD